MLGRAFQTCNLKNKNCSELLLTKGMGLDRAPSNFLTLVFLDPPSEGILTHQNALLKTPGRGPVEHASAVILHLCLLKVKVCLVRSDNSVTVPHGIHPNWRPSLRKR